MSLEQSAQISFRALSTRDNYDLEQSTLSKPYLEQLPQKLFRALSTRAKPIIFFRARSTNAI